MKIMRYSILVYVIIAAMLLSERAEATAFPRDVEWKEVHTEHFRVIYAERHREVIQNIAGMMESVHQDMSRFFNSAKEMKTDVIITDHLDSFERFDLEIVKGPGKAIVLHLGDRTAGAPSFDLRVTDWLVLQFVYQYTYVFRHSMDSLFRSFLSRFYPDLGFSGWMENGMALYMAAYLQGSSGRSPYLDMLLRADWLDNSPESLQERAAVGKKTWPGDMGLFLYGYSFLCYLSDTYGVNRLAELNLSQNNTLPTPLSKDVFEYVYGKNLQTLQQEWFTSLQEIYLAQIQDIQARPLTHSQPLTESGYFTGAPVFSPDGLYVYYIDDSAHDDLALIQLRLSDRKTIRLIEGDLSGSFSLSSDGQRLYFCKTASYKTYYRRSDLYVLDLSQGKSGKISRLTKGARAFDPTISPDNRTVVYVTIQTGRTSLMQLDLESGEQSVLLEFSDYAQIRQPAFSSDGTRLAAQISGSDGKLDIYVMNRDGKNMQPLMDDYAVDASPVWGPEDRYLFFNSDRFGVPNIFAYSFDSQQIFQVTNVLTGAFDPAISSDRKLLAFQAYSNNGMDIHLTDLMPARWFAMPFTQNTTSRSRAERFMPLATSEETRYKALSTLWPRLSPLWGSDKDGFQLGLNASAEDTLGHHAYSIDALYGFESERFEYTVEYMNKQWYPLIGLFLYERSISYSDLFRDTEGDSERYWESQQGGGVEIGFPFYKTRKTEFYLTARYEYQELESLMNSHELGTPLPDEGTLGSVSSRFIWQHVNEHRFSIGPESGFLTSLRYRRYDEIFGSDFNIDEVTGDVNLFLPMPFRHHTLFLRGAGGISDGDTLQQGLFQIGGFLLDFETELIYEPHFYLRGYETNTFSGDRFLLGTAEYWFPIWYIQKSSWNGVMLWDSLAGSVFVEAGHAWRDATEERDLKYSIGGELALDLRYKYGRAPFGIDVGVAHGIDEDEGKTQVYFRLRLNL
ncbi:hypothetical protein CSA56_00860 [candidate division KSB3 bacterium]|uniref:Bacterial surface antigen (D15) domain-containing protein n=1 Tax=candidate division KSB3 bacterium TaxID=2044937 RepID=A0A2G6KLK3_9BACT|nr:MAG: hypothetical protein CSA56_00860 [candidate division KSB3 bacterium]